MILTGWNVNFQGHNSSMPNLEASFPDFGKPHFNQSMHHEGSYTLLGQTFSANGQQKGIDALQYSCRSQFYLTSSLYKVVATLCL